MFLRYLYMALTMALAIVTPTFAQDSAATFDLKYDGRDVYAPCNNKDEGVESRLGEPSPTIDEIYQSALGDKASEYQLVLISPDFSSTRCDIVLTYAEKRLQLPHPIEHSLSNIRIGWRKCVPFGSNGHDILEMLLGKKAGAFAVHSWAAQVNTSGHCFTVLMYYYARDNALPQPVFHPPSKPI